MHKNIMGKVYDPNNISAKTLANIGRLILQEEVQYLPSANVKPVNLDSLKWLDIRIQEVCARGRL